MNITFFTGKIISKIEFQFIMKNNRKTKHVCICYFTLKLENNTIVKIKAFNNLADICYRSLRQGDFIAVYGTMNSYFEIDLIYYEKIIA